MMCDVLTLQFLIKHSQLNFYKSCIKTYTKYQSCIKNIFNIKRKIHGRFPSLQASHHRRVDLSLGNEWAGELRVPDPQGVLWGLDATDDHLLWAVSAGARLFGGVSRGIASAPDGVQGRHVLVHIGVGSIVLARAWSFTQILQVTTNLSTIGHDVGGGGRLVGLLAPYDRRQRVLVGGRVRVNAPHLGSGTDGVLRGMALPLGVDFLWRVKSGGGDFEGVEILLSGQQRVLRGTIHPSTGDPRINIVGRARTPVLEMDSSFQPPEGVGWLHLSGAVVGLTAYGRGQAIAAGARPSFSRSYHDLRLL